MEKQKSCLVPLLFLPMATIVGYVCGMLTFYLSEGLPVLEANPEPGLMEGLAAFMSGLFGAFIGFVAWLLWLVLRQLPRGSSEP